MGEISSDVEDKVCSVIKFLFAAKSAHQFSLWFPRDGFSLKKKTNKIFLKKIGGCCLFVFNSFFAIISLYTLSGWGG